MADFARARPRTTWARPTRVGFKVFASETQAEPDLSVTVNGLHMPNPFVIGSGPPGTNYTVMKRAFEEGWGAVIAKTVRLLFLFHENLLLFTRENKHRLVVGCKQALKIWVFCLLS